MREYLRRLLHLTPYSDRVVGRLTGRHELSVDLVMARGFAQRVLDVGCGNGWFEYMCADQLKSELCGVDPSGAMIEQAKQNAPHAQFVQGSVFELPFPDAAFDGAVMFEVIEHVPKNREIAALKEVRRVLKKGGWLVLSTPYAHPLSATLDVAWYFGHRHYSRTRICALMQAAGFWPEASIVRGGLWELSAVLALYAFKWLLNAESPLKDLVERRRQQEFRSDRPGISNVFIWAVAQ
jgi:SAM-dependent methyltransferase